MEEGVREFLKRVGYSIAIAFTWLAITAIAAIKGDNAFIQGPVRPANVIFYIWFVISVVLLIKGLKKIWNKKFEFKDTDGQQNI
jgi:hypothetical protein